MKENNKTSDARNYKSEKAVFTFLGLNSKQIVFRLLALVVVILLISETDSGTLMYGIYAVLAVSLILYLFWRKKLIADYKAVNIKSIPILPLHSHDFPMKNSIIMLGLILLGMAVLVVFIILFTS